MIASDIPNQFLRTRGQTSWQVHCKSYVLKTKVKLHLC